MVAPTPSDCRVAIDLRERRFGRSGRVVASCTLDLSETDKGEPAHVYVYVYVKTKSCSLKIFILTELCLVLKNANDKFGELTIFVASSSTGEAVQNANQAAEQLGPGLVVVNDAIQAITPLATEITAQVNAWKPLLSRLDALLKVANTVAKACFIPNYLSPATTKKY
jgi:hypothetical protein